MRLIGDPPFPPVVLFDEDRSFNHEDLRRITTDRPNGVSICIRYPEGPVNRGGYFFHFSPSAEQAGEFDICDFDRRFVKSLPAELLITFINHCTGRMFDEDSFILCQSELNFLKDEEPSA